MTGNIIDMRKRFIWLQLSSRLRRGEIKMPDSQELKKEFKSYVFKKKAPAHE